MSTQAQTGIVNLPVDFPRIYAAGEPKGHTP